MPTYADLRMAPPRSWEEFEDITCSAAKNRWANPDFTRHGRQGQEQFGVDIFNLHSSQGVIGIQCKNTWRGISLSLVKEEIANAEEFQPSLSHLYIATTAPTDGKVQREVLELSVARVKAGQFSVDILFWQDIWQDLTRDNTRLFQHFPELRPAPAVESHDQKLFRDFKIWLPYDPTVRYLNDHDFRSPVSQALIWPFLDFADEWEQPDREFLDHEVQQQHALLNRAAQELSGLIATKTYPVGYGNYNSVCPNEVLGEGYLRPQWTEDNAALLNAKSSSFVEFYAGFIKLCKVKLLR